MRRKSRERAQTGQATGGLDPLRTLDFERLQVDDVDVRAHADRQHAAVDQPKDGGRVLGLRLDHLFDRDSALVTAIFRI